MKHYTEILKFDFCIYTVKIQKMKVHIEGIIQCLLMRYFEVCAIMVNMPCLVKPLKQENIFSAKARCASLPTGQCLHSIYTDITGSLIYIIPCGRLHLSALPILLTYLIRIQIFSSTPRIFPSDSRNKSSSLNLFRFASSPQQVQYY